MQNNKDIIIELNKELSSLTNLSSIDQLEVKYLGRKGLINKLLQKIKDVPVNKKKAYGQKINQLKNEVKRIIKIKKLELTNNKTDEFFDATLPGKPYPRGSLHLITSTVEKISKTFQRIGFIRMSYPEVEWEYFSFDSLNMPPDHPARDDFETLFIDVPPAPKLGKMILSPHTSSGQVREMWRCGRPPIRMVSIAKCYRPNWDITHTPMFHQFESLCIDKNITITNLKATINYFVKEYFGEDYQARLRPFHFQFTEPSFEVDITCSICKGKGTIGHQKCKVCKSGWLELAGAGMVHHNVLIEGKINPEIYNGWAFAFGLERLIMIKIGLNNMRLLYDGDIRFLEQF